MAYRVKEIFYTLQGEGANTGRAAVFCRFSGCNLWSGCEEDRETAICMFCDTDFSSTDGPNGGCFESPEELSAAISVLWPGDHHHGERPFVVCTGGEPLLQLDEPLISALHSTGFEIAVETNGTIMPPPGIDWLCVSPKAGSNLVVQSGDELKLAYPQAGLEPESLEHLDFGRFYIQPIDGPDLEDNLRRAVQHCLRHPKWRLSLQIHKLLGIP